MMRRLSLRWRIFLIGLGITLPLLILEYLSDGWFPASLLFIPSSLVAEKVAQQYYGTPLHPQVYSGVVILVWAFWWYVFAGAVDAVRRRHPRRPQVSRG